MGRLVPLLVLAVLALLVIALIDCLSTDESDIRALPKVVWVFIILLFSPVGSIAWLIAGRPQRAATTPGGYASGRGLPEPQRPRRQLAPDDDPDFLRGLAKQRKEDEDLLRQWEADLRRREDELRRRDGDDDAAD